MPMHVNEDYSDMLSALNAAGVDYLIVGAYALGAHGNPRATGDIDIWVRPSLDNARRVWTALELFGAPRSEVRMEDFAAPDVVFQIGVPPRRIDLITEISGVGFDEAWSDRVSITLGDARIQVLSRHHLLRNKLAAGRPKDLADARWLEQVSDGDDS